MGKGSKRRPRAISDKDFRNNWDRIFKRSPETMQFIKHEQLQEISGYKQISAMLRYFRRIGIPVRQDRFGRLWTTPRAIDDTLAGKPLSSDSVNLNALDP